MLKIFKYIFIFFLFYNCFIGSVYSKKSKVDIPLSGKILQFSDNYGDFNFESEVIHYKTKDGAFIEATVLVPLSDVKKPGIIFSHMWARDRYTFWGLPEFFASYGYPSIYFDYRGHGNSRLPKSDKKITIKDKLKDYSDNYNDLFPAIMKLNQLKNVQKDKLILIGASLGAPLGVIGVKERQESFIGMILLSPAIVYFDVNCKSEAKKIKEDMAVFIVTDKNDKSFYSAKSLFTFFNCYKKILFLDGIGHGSDVLYHDIGFPTIFLTWVKEIEFMHENTQKFKKMKFFEK